jgi:hypothetical protein
VASKVDALALVKARFPGREELIVTAYWRDETFRSLCEDYRDCFVALDNWRRKESAEAGSRRIEYTQLLEELSEEIRDRMGELTG